MPGKKHVVLICFPAYGHIIPLLELSRKISVHHAVTFAISKAKLLDIQKRELFAGNRSNNMQFFGLEDGITEEFDKPDDPESFSRIIAGVLPSVKKLIDFMPTRQEPHSTEFPALRPVDVVIADSLVAGEVAGCLQRKTSYYVFTPAGASTLYTMLQTPDDCPTCPFEDEDCFYHLAKPGEPPQPISEMWKNMAIPIKHSAAASDGLVLNSFRDLELEGAELLESLPSFKGKGVFCVGPLLPESQEKNLEKFKAQAQVKEWLDGKKPRSVVYISFGSIASPDPEQLKELAAAFLSVERSFIWSLRTDLYKRLPEEMRNKIKHQFEEPAGDFLVLPWVPQQLILAHPSAQVFVSHCGWNSALEAAACGVPVVAWPMFADQMINAEWLITNKIAILLEGTRAYGKAKRLVPAAEIVEAIRAVGSGEFAINAKVLGKNVGTAYAENGASANELLELVKFSACKL